MVGYTLYCETFFVTMIVSYLGTSDATRPIIKEKTEMTSSIKNNRLLLVKWYDGQCAHPFLIINS